MRKRKRNESIKSELQGAFSVILKIYQITEEKNDPGEKIHRIRKLIVTFFEKED